MSIQNQPKRNVPILPDPNNSDTGQVIRQLIGAVRYLVKVIEKADLENSIPEIRAEIAKIQDVVNA